MTATTETHHTHPMDLVNGVRRVPYAPACRPKFGPHAGKQLSPGWVLPGGFRTTDIAEARHVAARIDALLAKP